MSPPWSHCGVYLWVGRLWLPFLSPVDRGFFSPKNHDNVACVNGGAQKIYLEDNIREDLLFSKVISPPDSHSQTGQWRRWKIWWNSIWLVCWWGGFPGRGCSQVTLPSPLVWHVWVRRDNWRMIKFPPILPDYIYNRGGATSQTLLFKGLVRKTTLAQDVIVLTRHWRRAWERWVEDGLVCVKYWTLENSSDSNHVNRRMW